MIYEDAYELEIKKVKHWFVSLRDENPERTIPAIVFGDIRTEE